MRLTFVAFVALTRFTNAERDGSNATTATEQSPRTLWLEVGANNGAYSAKMLRRVKFDTSIIIEPNERFVPELAELRRQYGARHMQAAAWIKATDLDFHVNRNDEASSLLKKSPSGDWKNLACRRADTFENETAHRHGVNFNGRAGNFAICDTPRTQRVRAVDLAKIIIGHAKRGDRVIMKMDIEGAEEFVMPHLISAGAADLLTMCDVEFHSNVNDSMRALIFDALRERGVLVWPGHFMAHLTRFLLRGPIPLAVRNPRAAAYLAGLGDQLDEEGEAAKALALATRVLANGEKFPGGTAGGVRQNESRPTRWWRQHRAKRRTKRTMENAGYTVHGFRNA